MWNLFYCSSYFVWLEHFLNRKYINIWWLFNLIFIWSNFTVTRYCVSELETIFHILKMNHDSTYLLQRRNKEISSMESAEGKTSRKIFLFFYSKGLRYCDSHDALNYSDLIKISLKFLWRQFEDWEQTCVTHSHRLWNGNISPSLYFMWHVANLSRKYENP